MSDATQVLGEITLVAIVLLWAVRRRLGLGSASASAREGRSTRHASAAHATGPRAFILVNLDPPNREVLVSEIVARYRLHAHRVYLWILGPDFDGASSGALAILMIQYRMRLNRDVEKDLQLDKLTFAEFEATLGIKGCVVAEPTYPEREAKQQRGPEESEEETGGGWEPCPTCGRAKRFCQRMGCGEG